LEKKYQAQECKPEGHKVVDQLVLQFLQMVQKFPLLLVLAACIFLSTIRLTIKLSPQKIAGSNSCATAPGAMIVQDKFVDKGKNPVAESGCSRGKGFGPPISLSHMNES
jgi:hypothetical protein